MGKKRKKKIKRRKKETHLPPFEILDPPQYTGT
jgi:hypothetical protein